jgi:hypothetical protein
MNPAMMSKSGSGSSSNMMDMFRSQLMTMTMFSSMNGNNNKYSGNSSHTNDGGGSGGGVMSDTIYGMMYVFLITQFMDFFCKNAPLLLSSIVKYYKDKIKSSKLANSLSVTINNQVHIKSSSIIIKLSITDNENIIGQALMDLITNNNNTKHVSFNKTNFILNQDDIIEIADDIFIQLIDTSTSENTADSKSSVNIVQTINLFSYSLTMQQLRTFLDKITYEFKMKLQNKLGTDIYYFNQMPQQAIKQIDGTRDYSKLPNNCIFTMKKFHTNRRFENLFGPEIDVIRNRVEFFTKNKKWYDRKGIPYTLGLLLSGQAGAGKTSTIKCLANETDRHIVNINLNNDITKNQLESLFFNEIIFTLNIATGKTEQFCIPLDRRIYVLEDIDCQSDMVMERTLNKPVAVAAPTTTTQQNMNKNINVEQDNSHKIDLSFLLNLLDGILETPGRIIIMTSNHPKLLDHALVRPGRIDIIADFKKCNNETIIKMIEYFYDIELSEEENELIMNLTDYVISPAEMGKIMFENFEDYTHAIKNVMSKAMHLTSKKTINNLDTLSDTNSDKSCTLINELPTDKEKNLYEVIEQSKTIVANLSKQPRGLSSNQTQQRIINNTDDLIEDYIHSTHDIRYKNFASISHKDEMFLDPSHREAYLLPQAQYVLSEYNRNLDIQEKNRNIILDIQEQKH